MCTIPSGGEPCACMNRHVHSCTWSVLVWHSCNHAGLCLNCALYVLSPHEYFSLEVFHAFPYMWAISKCTNYVLVFLFFFFMHAFACMVPSRSHLCVCNRLSPTGHDGLLQTDSEGQVYGLQAASHNQIKQASWLAHICTYACMANTLACISLHTTTGSYN